MNRLKLFSNHETQIKIGKTPKMMGKRKNSQLSNNENESITIKLTMKFNGEYLDEDSIIVLNRLEINNVLNTQLSDFFEMIEKVKRMFFCKVLNARCNLPHNITIFTQALQITLPKFGPKLLVPTTILPDNNCKNVYYIDITDIYNELQIILRDQLYQENIQKLSG
jgi:hypothetical protein